MLKRWLLLTVVLLLMSMGTAAYAAEGEAKSMTHGEVLFELGLINGTNEGLQEDREINRAQMIAIVNRLSEREGDKPFAPPAVPTFSDVPKTHWAYADIEKAYANGVTTGIGQGKFGVGNKITHQQAVTLLARTAGYEIDYANAVEEGWDLGIWLDADKPATANLYRSDVFELMVSTLALSIDEEEELYFFHLIPSISQEHRDWLMSDANIYLYNPMMQDFVYEPIADSYSGDDEGYAEASRRQFEYTTEVAKVLELYKGARDEAAFDAFFKQASGGKSSIAMPYEWSSFELDGEWGEFGYYGSTRAELTADGVFAGTIEATEGNDYLEAETLSVWQYGTVTVDGKKVTPYYVLMELPLGFEDDFEFYELFVLVDDQGVYKAAAVGSHGDGVYVRK